MPDSESFTPEISFAHYRRGMSHSRVLGAEEPSMQV
ncbi:hypothetical protein SCOCK_290029 [Actinacidiphila cocklensis]|uniref:Uncharacterized protein n=1 Tax=Actinacidiphila cocklensis TaxID=887465 RepID=A0A9W4DWB1_9ACTN|nr:hypothetical protein SCOCK_290029 [Actinacidiphila cocklensis]